MVALPIKVDSDMDYEEASSLIGRTVFTKDGLQVGTIVNLVLDVEERTLDSIFVHISNPAYLDQPMTVNVPFRWVHGIRDICVLNFLPSPDDITEIRRIEAGGARPPSRI